MSADDELGRAAEELRSFARAIGREARVAADSVREGWGRRTWGYHGWVQGSDGTWRPAGESWRAAARRARNDFRAGWGEGWGGGWGPGQGPGGAPGSAPTGGNGPAGSGPPAGGSATPGYPGGQPYGRPGGPPGWWGPRYRGPHRNGPGGWGGPPRRARPAPPPPRHRWDGSLVIGVLVVVVGLICLLGATHALSVSLEAVLAAALMIIGLGMVATARTDWGLSRRHWPIFLGVGVLALLVLSSNGLDFPGHGGGFGDRTVTPISWGQVGSSIHNDVGDLTVDLRHLPATTQRRTVTISEGVGEVRVILPPRLPVQVHASTDVGRACVAGRANNGISAQMTRTLRSAAVAPNLDLKVRVGAGDIRVEQAGSGGSC